MLVLLMGGIFFNYAVEVALCGTMHLPSFMKTATGVQAILRF
jgi:hypothetical protein